MAQNDEKNTGTSTKGRYYGNEDGKGIRKTDDRDKTNAAAMNRNENLQSDSEIGKREQVDISDQDMDNPGHDEEDRFDMDSLKGKVRRAESERRKDGDQ